MKKLAIGVALIGSILTFTGSNIANAQTVDLSQFKQLVELLIAIGAISPDKAEVARMIVGISTSTPVTETTSVQSAPVLGSVQSPVDFNPTVSLNDKKMTIVLPDNVASATFEANSNGQHDRTKLNSGVNIVDIAPQYRQSYNWTISASIDGQTYTKKDSFVWPLGSTICVFSDGCRGDLK